MMLVILQITSLMCFIYALKVKMFKNNLIGFLTISTTLSTVALSIAQNSYFDEAHYFITSLLLVFITSYHVYKKYKRHTREDYNV